MTKDVKFAVAVKAFIEDNGKFLLIKRREEDVHKPCHWTSPAAGLIQGRRAEDNHDNIPLPS